jgi:hypothetical protein
MLKLQLHVGPPDVPPLLEELPPLEELPALPLEEDGESEAQAKIASASVVSWTSERKFIALLWTQSRAVIENKLSGRKNSLWLGADAWCAWLEGRQVKALPP